MKSVFKAFILSIMVHSMAMGALWNWSVGVHGVATQVVEVDLTQVDFSASLKTNETLNQSKVSLKRTVASQSVSVTETQLPLETLRVGNIHIPAIEYPARCKSKGIEGVAVAKFQLTSSGKPSQVQLEKEVSECPEFSQKIVSALENSHFENLNSLNAESNIYRLPFRFQLKSK